MKKFVLSALIVVGIMTLATARLYGAAMNWGSGNVYGPSGTIEQPGDNWLHEFVYAGADNSIDGGDDTIIYSSTEWDAGGAWWYADTATFPSLAYTPGNYYFTRVWDSTAGGGGLYVATYLEQSPNPAADPEWGYPGAYADITQDMWVPEPTTLTLLGLGIATLAARRKFRRT